MLYKNSPGSTVLLTTPDYPPKLGGLSTLTKSVERSLKRLGLSYDVFVWENLGALKKSESIDKEYPIVINIHFFGCHFLKRFGKKHINFLHGTEILFTSPNPVKSAIKKIFKPFFIKSLSQSHLNIFISSFTLDLTAKRGLEIAYDRDIVFPNCIDVTNQQYLNKSLNDDSLKVICVARDVPHKNISSALYFAEELGKKFKKEVTLYVTKELPSRPLVSVVNIANISDQERDRLMEEAHFNLLLSLDHSNKGFVEGFGLTVLEAGKLGTPSVVSPYGGLPEACHHKKTGWVSKPTRKGFENLLNQINEENYQKIRKTCFDHTLNYHSEENYDSLFSSLLDGEESQ